MEIIFKQSQKQTNVQFKWQKLQTSKARGASVQFQAHLQKTCSGCIFLRYCQQAVLSRTFLLIAFVFVQSEELYLIFFDLLKGTFFIKLSMYFKSRNLWNWYPRMSNSLFDISPIMVVQPRLQSAASKVVGTHIFSCNIISQVSAQLSSQRIKRVRDREKEKGKQDCASILGTIHKLHC